MSRQLRCIGPLRQCSTEDLRNEKDPRTHRDQILIYTNSACLWLNTVSCWSRASFVYRFSCWRNKCPRGTEELSVVIGSFLRRFQRYSLGVEDALLCVRSGTREEATSPATTHPDREQVAVMTSFSDNVFQIDSSVCVKIDVNIFFHTRVVSVSKLRYCGRDLS